MFNIKFAFCILSATLFFAACKSNKNDADAKQAFVISDSLLKTLHLHNVKLCPVVKALTLTGKVTFNEDKVVRLLPMVSGNITGVTIQLGDHVNKGQQLGIIRSGEMADYGNDLVTAKTNLLIAQKSLDASQDMFKSGLISQKDLVTAEEIFKQAQSQLTRSKEVLQINGGSTNGVFVIRAPISGFVVEKQINNDMAIRPDNNNDMFTISDLKDVWVMANVYESNIGQVHLGDDVEVTTLSYPGRIFHGKVDKILNVLDPTNKVMKVRIVLPNPEYALKPEMFASVQVLNNTNEQSLCVPSSSVIFENSQYFVLIYKSPTNVVITPVQVISSNANKTYITGQVQVGDQVIGLDAVLIYSALNS